MDRMAVRFEARVRGLQGPRRTMTGPSPRPIAAPTSDEDDHPMTTEQRAATAPIDEALTTARMFIGAESVDAADGQSFEVVNPATGKTIATAPLGGREDVDRAVAAAQK